MVSLRQLLGHRFFTQEVVVLAGGLHQARLLALVAMAAAATVRSMVLVKTARLIVAAVEALATITQAPERAVVALAVCAHRLERLVADQAQKAQLLRPLGRYLPSPLALVVREEQPLEEMVALGW